MCVEIAARMLDAHLSERFVDVREVRLWNTKPRWSGRFDLVAYDEDKFMVLDYKTGRNEAPIAADNLQIRAGIALAAQQPLYENQKNLRGFGVIVQPWCSPQYSVVEYSAADIERAREECNSIVRLALKDDTRTPGDHCRWCPAKLICEEFKLHAGLPAKELELGLAPTKKTVEAAVTTLTAEKLSAALDYIAPMQWLIDAAKAEARRRIENNAPDAPADWELKPGNAVEKIVDVRRAFANAFASYDVTGAEFAEWTSITKKALSDGLRAKTGLKGNELEAVVADVITGCTETKQNAPSLVKVKDGGEK